jgi:hypothetical protein
MKSQQDIRMECAKLANSMVTSKAIEPAQMITYANILHDWITEKHAATSARDIMRDAA